MDPITAFIVNPYIALILALILGVLGNLSTEGLKKWWGKYSENQREKNKEEEDWIVAQAAKCAASTRHLIFEQTRHAVHTRLHLGFMIASVVAFIFATFLATVMLAGRSEWVNLLDMPLQSSMPTTFSTWSLSSFQPPIITFETLTQVTYVLLLLNSLWLAIRSGKSSDKARRSARIIFRAEKILNEADERRRDERDVTSQSV